jgi:hypothetical protein
MDQTQAQAQAQAEAEAQAQAQAARAEVEAYVTPQLLDREIRPKAPLVPACHPRRGCWTRVFPYYAHVAANPRPLGSQVCELTLCYCLYLHLSFCCN